MNFKFFIVIFLNVFKLRNCLICSYCNRCSFNDQDTSQTCSEPNSSCFSGKQNGLIYQGCTTQNYFQLQSLYTNVELCYTNYCNRKTQSNNRYSISCYNCMGCNVVNANKYTQICPDSTYKCYSGSRSNIVYQGCTSSTLTELSTIYSNVRVCSTNLCNSYRAEDFGGISCYSCQGCSNEYSANNIQQVCPDNTYKCYVGIAVGRIYQGCTKESYSTLSSRLKNVILCSGNLCNANNLVSMGPTCYECYGCMDNLANIRTQKCADSSYRCFSGTKLGFTYQGCTKWSDQILNQNYNHLKVCRDDFCNIFNINSSLVYRKSVFLIFFSLCRIFSEYIL